MAINDGVMIKTLTEIANQIATQARTNASWSKDISRAISVDPVVVTNDGYQVDILVKAPQAAAFEFGSGIHRTRGTPETYKIKPKNASALAFQWNPANPIGALSSNKVIDYLPDEDIWLFREVDHPGVEARPYMRPAIKQILPEARKKLNISIRALLVTGKKVEIIE